MKYNLLKNSTWLLNDQIFYKLQHLYIHLKHAKRISWPNIKKPKSFNEKMLWLKLNYRNVYDSLLVDKYKVRDYVKEKVGEKYLIPLLKVYSSPSEITIENLPQKFVLKPNHGSGWLYICRNKKEIDITALRKKFEKWHSKNFYFIGREWQYRNIKPVIVCETLLEDQSNKLLDYKFFCFNGNPKYIQIDVDRFDNHKRVFYDSFWNKMPFTTLYPKYEHEIPKPSNYNEMENIARKLSDNFAFARIDLYTLNNKVYFGEITLFHGSGNEPFYPKEFDNIVGDDIILL